MCYSRVDVLWADKYVGVFTVERTPSEQGTFSQNHVRSFPRLKLTFPRSKLIFPRLKLTFPRLKLTNIKLK